MKKDRVQDKFLEELRKIPIVQVACERCGISRQSVYRWRKEDSDFAIYMDQALDEGEELLNDLCESQLLALVKDKNFQAIKYRLDKRHPKYRKPLQETKSGQELDGEEIIQLLGLTDEDFLEENYDKTVLRITRYLRERR